MKKLKKLNLLSNDSEILRDDEMKRILGGQYGEGDRPNSYCGPSKNGCSGPCAATWQGGRLVSQKCYEGQAGIYGSFCYCDVP